ncbi:unnamed protein product [Malus baccata var. baccata]
MDVSNQITIQEEAAGSSFMDLDVYNAAKAGEVDVLWKHRDHLDRMLTPTKNTVLHVYIACSTLTESDSEEALLLVMKSANVVEKIVEMCPPLLFQPNDGGDTALHVAARHGCTRVVQVLLKQAAKRDCGPVGKLMGATNKVKDTALHEAVRFNHRGVVQVLTREDPEVLYSANVDGDTPLYLAAERGYRDLVFEMLGTCKCLAYGGRNGRTALHAAVICNDEEMTRELLKYTAKMALTKAVDGQGWTPLHFAALFGHPSIAKQLLESDRSAAYIGDKEYRQTPLHIAAFEGHEGVMRELVLHCPDCCELVDYKGRNVLHYAVKWCQSPIVQDFVLKDPWVSNTLLNGKDANGNTPLHLLALSPLCASDRFVGDGRVDKMAFNKANLNALDIVLADETLPPTLKSANGCILGRNGARPGCHRIVCGEDSVCQKFYPFRKIEIEQFEENKGGSRSTTFNLSECGKDTDVILKQVKEAHLVMATLIATATFAAGFVMPGGCYQSEKGSPSQDCAVLTRQTAYQAFVVMDALALFMSTCSVLVHFYLSRPDAIVWALSSTMTALIFTVTAFITGTYAVSGHSPGLAIAACVLGFWYFSAALFMLGRPCTKAFWRHFFPVATAA